MEKDFAGKNGYIWWTGVIVDRKDPANVGRCKVRIFGWHDENENKVPVKDLPWAQVLLPVNNSKSIALPKEGEWVSGFFLDGNNAQMPVVVGVFPGILTNPPRQVTSDAEQLKVLEAQLVVEKQKLVELEKNYQTTTRASLVVKQKQVISALESQISKLKSNLNKKPGIPWQDERKQSEVNGDPTTPTGVVFYNQGEPTITRIGRGVIEGTIVDKNNKDLAHVCDFISEMQKNINLKKYTKAIANQIREAIRWVMKALGFSDATGQFSWILNTLKAYARELKRIQKEIIQPIIDFEKYVLAYLTKIRAMISWLLSLPERFLALLKNCLDRLLKLIAHVMTDTISGLFSGDGNTETSELISAAKDAVNETYNTINQAGLAVGGAQVIINTATTGLLVPVSESELSAANTYINSYTTSGNNIVSSVTAGLQAP